MTWIIILVIVVFFVWRMKPTKGVQTVSSTDVKPITKDKTKQFVDVRTPAEYKGNHVKEFTNIPLNDLGKRIGELDKDKETYVICQSGMRSARAASMLKKQGFTNIYNVKGGMSTWQ